MAAATRIRASADAPHVVILGAGFGGLFAAKALARTAARVTVVDRQNYHLFQPLLYQVATAGLPPSDIAWPIRSMLRRQPSTTVLMDTVTRVDLDAREVVMQDRGAIGYDWLVVATGARHSYFGNEGWQEVAPGLKSIDDAVGIRRRILLAFERAEMTDDAAERERLLRFVIVGGGPTGVELAGAITELAHYALARDFRRIDPRSARVLLVEAGPRLLPAFRPGSSEYANRALRALGVEVRLGAAVTDMAGDRIRIGDEVLEAGTVVWAAGVAATAAGLGLAAQADRAGRVAVQPDLTVAGHPEVFVIGDAALARDRDGTPLPGIAPVAKQQGRYVARFIRARLAGKSPPGPFRYRHAGNLATIGRRAAVIEFGPVRLRGRIAWWIWGVSHIYFLVGVRSPLLVTLNWLWQYLSYAQGARLITGSNR